MKARAENKRQKAVKDMKRRLILDAARSVFEKEGLEGASLRAIASAAGYTPAALYFHFPSREAIYAEILKDSLTTLASAINNAVLDKETPEEKLHAAAMTFFRYYKDNPRDLDLGFYLFRGGMKPQGLGKEHDRMLNEALATALSPISGAAQDLGATSKQARIIQADIFAHAAGLLLLAHTGRIRIFGASAPDLMEKFVELTIAPLH